MSPDHIIASVYAWGLFMRARATFGQNPAVLRVVSPMRSLIEEQVLLLTLAYGFWQLGLAWSFGTVVCSMALCGWVMFRQFKHSRRARL